MALIVLAMAWFVGIATVALWDAPVWVGALLFAAPIPLPLARASWRGALLLIGLALVALAGSWRFAAGTRVPTPDAQRFVGRTITFQGSILSEPVQGETTAALYASIERVRSSFGWLESFGRVRLSLSQYAHFLPGDRIQVTGKLEEPPVFDDFDYRAYLARQGTIATMYRPGVSLLSRDANRPRALIARFRLRLDAALQRALPEPAASLAGGIAFGRDGGMPDSLYSEFRATGLAHIVAVSGSNVSLVAALVSALLIPIVGRRIAVWPAAALIVLYVVLAGASASVVRAGIMGLVFLVGEWLGRPQAGLPALGLAAVVMTAAQPVAALDIGFQLSVAATAGIIAFEPWLRTFLERTFRRGIGLALPAFIYQSAALTLAATVATLPFLWLNFGRISLVSPLANVLVAPLLVVALPLAMFTALVGALSPALGWAMGLLCYYPVALIIWLASHLARVPGASIPLPGMNGTTAAATVAGLLAIGWLVYRFPPAAWEPPRTDGRIRFVRRLAALGLVGGAALAVLPVSVLPISGPGDFEMVALDVGQGDAILLRTPHGRTMLVDGGSSDQVLARQLGAVLPHWQRTLDAVFMTHPDEDHVGGLPGVVSRFKVSHLWDPGTSGPGSDASTYARLPGRISVHAGDHFELDGVAVEVLWPPANSGATTDNATSLVLRVTYGSTRFLLTADLEAKEQHLLAGRESVEADVLKVPHHGAKTSDPAFFRAVGATVAVISVGANNRFGHPAQKTLDALADEQLFRTDRDGRVTVHSDGRNVRVATER